MTVLCRECVRKFDVIGCRLWLTKGSIPGGRFRDVVRAEPMAEMSPNLHATAGKLPEKVLHFFAVWLACHFLCNLIG